MAIPGKLTVEPWMMVWISIKLVWVPPTNTRFVTWKENMYLLGRTTVPIAPTDTAPEGKDEAGRNMPSTELVGESVGEAEGWYIDGRPDKPGFPSALKDKRASRYPMVFGMLPSRPKPLMFRPETRVAPPTVPHVTPLQALMPVTQGS